MSPGLQLATVCLLVAWSGLVVLRRLAPRASWQAQARLSYWLERPGRPAWLRRIGAWLRPSLAVTASACSASLCRPRSMAVRSMARCRVSTSGRVSSRARWRLTWRASVQPASSRLARTQEGASRR